eukprot:4133849-Pyramimonas_sp.AAC.1
MRAAVGGQQFGLAEDGRGALRRRPRMMANAQPGRWVKAVDLGDALGNIPRELVKESIRAKVL